MPPIDLRILTSADAAAFWHLRLEALETVPEAFGTSADEHRATGIESAAARLGADPGSQFVMGAFADDALAGIAGFYRSMNVKESHKGNLWGVYVTAGLRGTGVGRRIVCAVLERAAGMEGIEQIGLLVATTQVAAKRLYESLGFQSFGCERRALKIGEQYVDEDHMVLYLAGRGPGVR